MPTERPIRLMMVDDHPVVRDGMKSLLELDGFATVVATASSAEEALVMIDRVACDLVLLDIGLPRGDGIWCARAMRARLPEQRILVLSMHSDEHILRDALEAGVNGYVLKSASFDEVKRAITDVHAGHTHIEPRLAGVLLGRSRLRSTPAPAADAAKILSARERDVLTHIASGKTNQEVADLLGLTVNTVKAHLKSIYRKLDVSDRVQVVLHAIRLGIVDAPDVQS